jgi:hypothetical protein
MEPTVHRDLQANVEMTVTLPGIIRGWRVTHRGTEGDADISWRWAFNTVAPAAVLGDGTYNLGADREDQEDDASYLRDRFAGGAIETTKFSLICPDAVPFSVETW